MEKPTDARIRRQSRVGAVQEKCIGSINKAEIVKALHMVEKKKTSFASAKGDSDRFNLMFPGSIFAKGYQQSDSKVQYVIKYGIADHLKKQLICDVKNTPYSLLFDETTNSQVKSNMMGV